MARWMTTFGGLNDWAEGRKYTLTDEGGRPRSIDIREFMDANREGLTLAEHRKVMMLKPGESLRFGGGAAPLFTLKRVDSGGLSTWEPMERYPVENGVTVHVTLLREPDAHGKRLSGAYAIQAYADDASVFMLTTPTGRTPLARANSVAALQKWAKKNGAKRVEFIG